MPAPYEMEPITHDHHGQKLETGFAIGPSSGSIEMDVDFINVYLGENSDFINIVTDEQRGHVYFDIADLDHVIDALTRIRTARVALIGD